jgi:hypothetical protein
MLPAELEPLNEFIEDISNAQEIIQNLVNDPEQSFLYHEKESDSFNDQTNIFNQKKRYDDTKDLSFSFETTHYLKKYGLE